MLEDIEGTDGRLESLSNVHPAMHGWMDGAPTPWRIKEYANCLFGFVSSYCGELIVGRGWTIGTKSCTE